MRFPFYDLTALVLQGAYRDSQLAGYGFAHNTPSGKQKVKLGATASADGGIPADYAAHGGRKADLATVQENMARLCRLLERQGQPLAEVLLIGDRANLNDELACAYVDQGLKPGRRSVPKIVVAPSRAALSAPPAAETALYSFVKVRNLG